MAATFVSQGSTHTTEVTGGNTVVPVQEFAMVTVPGPNRWYEPNATLGIYWQFRRPSSQLAKLDLQGRKDLIQSLGDQFSARIEAVMAEDNVAWIAYSQPTNTGGQLVDVMTITVLSNSGDSQTTVAVPLSEIGPGDYTTSRVQHAIASLNAIEGL